MPLYLLHTSGLAVFLVGAYLINGRAPLSGEISLSWWLWRPAAIVLPLTTTVPLLWLVGRVVKGSRTAAKVATEAIADIAESVADAARSTSEKL